MVDSDSGVKTSSEAQANEKTGPTVERDEKEGCRPSAVHLRFPSSMRRRLQRSEPTTCADGQALWAERPMLMKRADGTFELIGTSRNLKGVARWILSFGTDAEVCGPTQLRRLVCKTARRIQRLYDEDAT
jgi:predicted DNA-binding transcriptional regulator YafY